MKLKLLPLALGALVAMPVVALAEPTVYGKVNVTVEMDDVDAGDGGADVWEVNSNASRLGVKGSEKISDELSAIYKLEYEVAVDDGDAVFKQRNIFGGLKGGFGEVIVGNFDTPVKAAQNKVDVFSDYQYGDIKNVIVGENRESNLIQYSTPSMSGIKAAIAIQPGEQQGGENNGPADAFSAMVSFEQDGFYGAVAYDSEIESSFGDEDTFGEVSGPMDIIRLVGQATIEGFQIGAIYQMAEESDGDEEQTGIILSGTMKVGGSGKVKAQFGTSELDLLELEFTQIGLGYEHKLSKQSKLFAHYIMLEAERGNASVDWSTIAVGMEHKF